MGNSVASSKENESATKASPTVVNVILTGTKQSGKTTLLKQLRGHYDDNDLPQCKVPWENAASIRKSCIKSMKCLIFPIVCKQTTCRLMDENFEIPSDVSSLIYTFLVSTLESQLYDIKNKGVLNAIDEIYKYDLKYIELTDETMNNNDKIWKCMKLIWKNDAIKQMYDIKIKCDMHDDINHNSSHFFDQIDTIGDEQYSPNLTDISMHYQQNMTNDNNIKNSNFVTINHNDTIKNETFNINILEYHDPRCDCNTIITNAKHLNCKSIFRNDGNINGIIFLSSLIGYRLSDSENNQIMYQSFNFFRELITAVQPPTINIIVFLNKFYQFEKEIKQEMNQQSLQSLIQYYDATIKFQNKSDNETMDCARYISKIAKVFKNIKKKQYSTRNCQRLIIHVTDVATCDSVQRIWQRCVCNLVNKQI